jgi:hypothetical protein
MIHFPTGATYVGSKMLSPQEAFPLLLADVDPAGNLVSILKTFLSLMLWQKS